MAWSHDKKWLLGVGLAISGSLSAWGANKMADSYEKRGTRLDEIEKHQEVADTKAALERQLLQEVRDDVKEILRRTNDSRLSSGPK